MLNNMMVQDTLTAAMFCLAVPRVSFTNRGSVVRELGCAHVAVADYPLVSSALYSYTWVLEMPQEAQHVNPDVKLTQKAAAVRSVLPSRESKRHTAHALVLSLAWRREEELPHSAPLPPTCSATNCNAVLLARMNSPFSCALP